MFENFDLTPELIRKLVLEIELQQNVERKKRTWISNQIRDGRLYDYVQNRLKVMYPKNWMMYSVAEYSIAKKIIDKKSRAYKRPPLRRVSGDQNATTAYQELLKKYRFNAAMKTFDAIYNEHKYSLLACLMDTDSAGNPFHKFFALAPWEFDAVFDKDGNLKIVILSNPGQTVKESGNGDAYNAITAESGDADEGINRRVYVIWTDKQHMELIVTGKLGDINSTRIEIRPLGPNESGVNPYGVLPFVYAPMTMDTNYPLPSPLPSQTVELNALMSVYLTSANQQVGVFVLKYPSDQPINMVAGSMYTAVQLPQSKNPEDARTEADFISPNPDLAGHKDAVLTYATAILDEHGLTTSAVTGNNQTFTSALDRIIANADVQDAIEENQEMYSEVERKAYSIISAQLKSVGSNIQLPANDLVIVYPKPKVLVSDSEILENMKKMKELGIFHDWELLQVFDPNLDETQSKDKLTDIAQAKRDAIEALGTDPSKVFNGAQVASIVEVATKVAIGELTEEAAANILSVSFGINPEIAKTLIPPAGSVTIQDAGPARTANTRPANEETDDSEDED